MMAAVIVVCCEERAMARILGIGELLWDVFPHGKILGGAPANFVFHCRQMGHPAMTVSRIGDDDLGREMLRALSLRQNPATLVQIDPARPTGTVQITMNGEAHSFAIVEEVAWDFLQPSKALRTEAEASDAVCFGSLAQRNEVSRTTILDLVGLCRGLRLFDINLRQHFYSRSIIENSLKLATALKLNDEEIVTLGELLELKAEAPAAIARSLIEGYQLDVVCVTRSSQGAMMVSPDRVVEHPGFTSKVADTVGCGDAFSAVLVDGMLRGKDLYEICEHANRVGAFVASQAGATPEWPDELRRLVTGE